MTASETIHAYYDAFNQQRPEAMLELLTEDVVHDANEGGSETGKDAFGTFLGRMADHYQESVEDLEVMANAAGSRAAAEFFIRGTYLKTDGDLPEAEGQKYHLRVGAFFELRDGRISRVTNYYNLRAWVGMVAGQAD
jgi:steroid delta-isomerase-like uncharacterized protein